MPLINFKCNACGETFGSFQRLRGGSASGTPCPSCGSDETVAADTSLDSVSREPAAGTKTAIGITTCLTTRIKRQINSKTI